MELLTEITFLYTNTHHSLSVEWYLQPSFITQFGLDNLNSEFEW